MNDLKQALRRELVSHFRFKGKLDDDTGLFSGGHIDSLSVMDLVSFVETEIGCQVPPDAITLDNFDSISRIVRFAESLTSSGGRD
jgi:acyl carrier protein